MYNYTSSVFCNFKSYLIFLNANLSHYERRDKNRKWICKNQPHIRL